MIVWWCREQKQKEKQERSWFRCVSGYSSSMVRCDGLRLCVQ